MLLVLAVQEILSKPSVLSSMVVVLKCVGFHVVFTSVR